MSEVDTVKLLGDCLDQANRNTERAILQARREYAAGRLAGLREAAEVARSIKSYDDSLQRSAGCATTGERISATILALAKP